MTAQLNNKNTSAIAMAPANTSSARSMRRIEAALQQLQSRFFTVMCRAKLAQAVLQWCKSLLIGVGYVAFS